MPAVLLRTLNEDLKENTLKKRKGGVGGKKKGAADFKLFPEGWQK